MDEIINQSKLCKRSLKPDSNKYHMELVDSKNLTFDKPTVFCISGNGTNSEYEANALGSQAERYLDLLFKAEIKNSKTSVIETIQPLNKCDIYSVIYNGDKSIDKSLLEQIVKAMFALLVDKNGNRLELEQAKKNMSRLSFFTFCAGNVQLTNILFKLARQLYQVGYNDNEILLIFNASLEVSYAPNGEERNVIPSVRIISNKDTHNGWSSVNDLIQGNVLKAKDENAEILEVTDDFDGIALHQDNPGTLYGLSREFATANSIQIITSKLLNAANENFEEHDISLIKRDENWNLRPFTPDKNKPEISYSSPNADCVSQMVAWALCKGVENSVQNFESDKYVPNTYYNELMEDFESIMDSYKQGELLRDFGKKQNQDLGTER